MSYRNPQILPIDSPAGFDEVVESYRTAFSALSWLDRSFGRAFEQPENSNTRRTPKVYVGKGEYYNVLPNDSLKSQSFLMSRSAERYTPGQEQGRERDMSAVFWFNLKTIFPDRDEYSVEELLRSVVDIIEAAPWTAPAGIARVYDERVEDIFFGYLDNDFLEKNYQFLQWPFAGFRIDFVAGWPVPC